jgi:hypothetical protein
LPSIPVANPIAPTPQQQALGHGPRCGAAIQCDGAAAFRAWFNRTTACHLRAVGPIFSNGNPDSELFPVDLPLLELFGVNQRGARKAARVIQ